MLGAPEQYITRLRSLQPRFESSLLGEHHYAAAIFGAAMQGEGTDHDIAK